VNIQANGYFSEARSASAYLNQPAKTLTPVMTTYDTDGIDTAIMEMQLDLAAMQEADPVRRAGPVQCAKCKGKLICPEFEAAQPMQMATIDGAPGRPLSKETIELHLDRLPGVDLARVLDWVPALDHLCSLAKNEAKKRLREDATSVPGWGIKPNAPRSQVEDLAKVYGRLITEYQITGLEFSTACSITKKNVIQIVRDKSGLKGASLDSKVKEILDGATREIKVSNSLEKVK
jgi:hypothetical protein